MPGEYSSDVTQPALLGWPPLVANDASTKDDSTRTRPDKPTDDTDIKASNSRFRQACLTDADGDDSRPQGAPPPLSVCGIDNRLLPKLEMVAPGVALSAAHCAQSPRR